MFPQRINSFQDFWKSIKTVPAFLLMSAGANAGARFELSREGQNLLGRDWQCKVVLNDPQCSRVHAEIFRDEDGWWVATTKAATGLR